ncbi:MAG: Sapep family Mn(2+)-dependent dipeptidase [Clostridia bacterium]|nr:Sapep family Mn(2+)-dependent dipeptidase [Clostridia bacterium]
MFGDRILNYWDDIVTDLKAMIAIPSVCGKPEGEYPFGKEPARAIDLAMELGAKYGFKTKNVGYYACHAEIGEGEENAVVMAHLDVVPEGEGWDSDPYTLTERDGFFYARGISDNKGPAIIALHCLRALKDAGVQGKRKLRVVLGSGEEIGMADMENYFASEQLPTMGFTPDAGYGVCNCEKGILHFTVENKNDSSVVKSFNGGTVVNAVPYKAEADIVCSDFEYDVLAEAAYKLGDFLITRTDDGCHIVSNGVAAHGASPEIGKNAAAYLIDLLYSVFGNKIGSVLTFAYNKIGLTYDGSKIGVACSDAPSGKLTFNLGIVKVDADKAEFSIDIRYPATLNGKDIIATIKSAVETAGLQYTNETVQPPLYLPADSKLVTILKSAYEDVTGENCRIFSMGGGTYARQMGGNGVAFGASFGRHNERGHNSNENSCIEDMKEHARICLEAMYRLYTAD